MTKAEKAASLAEKIAADNSHGYQWGGWGPNYDCGHLVIDVYERAGIPVRSKGGASYTGDMRRAFLACGCKDVAGQVNLRTGEGLKTGDALVNEKNHAAIFVGNGKIVQARSDFDGVPGDSSGQEIRVQPYYNYPWNCVLRYTGDDEERESAPAETKPVQKTDELPVLRRGMKNQSVMAMQAVLIALGYDCGPDGADGNFGPNTEAAVTWYQIKNGLQVDGECGPETWGSLLGVTT